ncbi:hypothetical protein [Lewinella sp. W8]|uniref:hypothetical protein n=1 Tax=Lewinella sp. W8 TaxID=2528208 RepID=UPI001067A5A8|nr:hypothetical protein [Lewinella sp. W8]MTB53003.1 hypothetical protein [Lewinella sp. W8]
MTVVFTGVHFKPGKKALDSSTLSGSVVDDIIKLLPPGWEFKKVNLYQCEYLPSGEEAEEQERWFFNQVERFYEKTGGLIVYAFCGRMVEQRLKKWLVPGTYVPHPASIVYQKSRLDFISHCADIISDRAQAQADLVEYINRPL